MPLEKEMTSEELHAHVWNWRMPMWFRKRKNEGFFKRNDTRMNLRIYGCINSMTYFIDLKPEQDSD